MLILGIAAGAYGQDWSVSGLIHLPQTSSHFITIRTLQMNVNQNQIGALMTGLGQAFQAVGGQQHQIAIGFQNSLDQTTVVRIMVDVQNFIVF